MLVDRQVQGTDQGLRAGLLTRRIATRSIKSGIAGGRTYRMRWGTCCGRSAGRGGRSENECRRLLVNIAEHQPGASGIRRAEGDVEAVPGSLRRRRTVARERVRVPGAPAQGAGEVYGERLSRVFYENYAGSIIDWYAATLLRREPVLLFEGTTRQRSAFFNLLRRRLRPEGHEPERTSSGSDSWRRWCAAAVTWWWIFPRCGTRPSSRAEEDASGRSRAYLVDYTAGRGHQLELRPTGGLEWAVIRTSCLQQSKVTDGELGERDAVDLLRPGKLSDLPQGRRGRSRWS